MLKTAVPYLAQQKQIAVYSPPRAVACNMSDCDGSDARSACSRCKGRAVVSPVLRIALEEAFILETITFSSVIWVQLSDTKIPRHGDLPSRSPNEIQIYFHLVLELVRSDRSSSFGTELRSWDLTESTWNRGIFEKESSKLIVSLFVQQRILQGWKFQRLFGDPQASFWAPKLE